MDIITINGISCYEEDGVVYLNLEAVARGLGFTRVAASGNEVVRWETVRKYLLELNVPTSWHEDSTLVGKTGLPDYLPENIFYRLAMKAKNEVAERFQALIADEVIPSIRKHGGYLTPALTEKILADPDTIIRLATDLKAERERARRLSQQIEADAPKVAFAESFIRADTDILIREMAKHLTDHGFPTGQNKLYQLLRNEGYLIKSGQDRNLPSQRSMNNGWMTIKTTTRSSADSTKIDRTTLITPKGQEHLLKHFCGKRYGLTASDN